MSKILDNLSLILVVVGGFFSLLSSILWTSKVISLGSTMIFAPLGILAFAGLIIGIVALAKGSEQKWKPIAAICIYILVIIINLILTFAYISR